LSPEALLVKQLGREEEMPMDQAAFAPSPIDRDAYNGVRWLAGEPRGHYESWFLRANHPAKPRAFWIRYTIFSPKDRPKEALGELWAMFFDGETRTIVAVKEELPIRVCTFAKSGLSARIGDATLDGESLRGKASCEGHTIAWSLRYTSPKRPLLLLPENLYAAPFPKAKAAVPSPHAAFDGTITIDGAEQRIDEWIGSQNHNWGEKHTDTYAWGQVAGFDDAPDAFLEAITAKLKLGPITTPPMTILVLRLDGEEHRFNTIGESLRHKGHFDFFQWRFSCGDASLRIDGTIAAAASDFVGLPYYNPPGGTKTCLNSKIARCDVTVRREGEVVRTLSTRNRAAFEILTERMDHGVRVLNPRKK
jgi:hypothetical protein